jgi:hypothetical protein
MALDVRRLELSVQTKAAACPMSQGALEPSMIARGYRKPAGNGKRRGRGSANQERGIEPEHDLRAVAVFNPKDPKMGAAKIQQRRPKSVIRKGLPESLPTSVQKATFFSALRACADMRCGIVELEGSSSQGRFLVGSLAPGCKRNEMLKHADVPPTCFASAFRRHCTFRARA